MISLTKVKVTHKGFCYYLIELSNKPHERKSMIRFALIKVKVTYERFCYYLVYIYRTHDLVGSFQGQGHTFRTVQLDFHLHLFDIERI